jgi:hypothetical protein
MILSKIIKRKTHNYQKKETHLSKRISTVIKRFIQKYLFRERSGLFLKSTGGFWKRKRTLNKTYQTQRY